MTKNRINAAYRKGAMIVINQEITISNLNEIYKSEKVVFTCHDGRCVDCEIERV